MSSGMYVSKFDSVAQAALSDIWEILAPTDATIIVHAFELMQTLDVGDAAEEIIHLETVRGVGATVGSGGTDPAMEPLADGQAATGAVTGANNTTRMVAGGGSLEELEIFGWNVRIPLEKIWTPETRPIISPGQLWTLAMPAAPTDSLTLASKIIWEEIGG